MAVVGVIDDIDAGAATSPLQLVRFNSAGAPVFNFIGPKETFIDDPSLLSRWQIQLGLKYFFE